MSYLELYGATQYFRLVAPFSKLFGATQSFFGGGSVLQAIWSHPNILHLKKNESPFEPHPQRATIFF